MHTTTKGALIRETELPGRRVNDDTRRIIGHRYRWAAQRTEGKRVLEIGCGPGLGLGYLRSRATYLIGGDLVADTIDLAHAHYGSRVPLLQMDGHRIPLKDTSVEAIVCLAALIYLDAGSFFRECRRVLTHDGMLVLNTPNKDVPGFGPSALSREYHSVPELCLLLDSEGFDSQFFGAFTAPVAEARGATRLVIAGRNRAIRLLERLGLYQTIKVLVAPRQAGTRLPTEIDTEVEMASGVAVTPLTTAVPDTRHRIIYVMARPK